jgi:membrane-bound lytic murein transglycosylase D
VDGPSLRTEIVADMMSSYYEHLGCGPLNAVSGSPYARKTMVSDPASAQADASEGGNVSYKTMWVKERRVHTVRNGETLSSIAVKYGSTYHQVKKWNRLSSNKIMKGQRLYVYVSVPKKVAIPNADVLDNEDETVADDNDGALKIASAQQQPDDSLKSADSTTAALKEVPAPQKPVAAKKPVPAPREPSRLHKQYVYHVVQPGDTLWSISQRYNGISVDEIKRANNIYNSRSLKPGTRLKIKVKA